MIKLNSISQSSLFPIKTYQYKLITSEIISFTTFITDMIIFSYYIIKLYNDGEVTPFFCYSLHLHTLH